MDTERYTIKEPDEAGVVPVEEEPALTSAEAEQIIDRNRDRLYNISLKAAIVFLVLSVALMTGFKANEGFFDANSRIGLLMESIQEQEDQLSYSKINVRANFQDEKGAKLVIPLAAAIDSGQVSVREEFTKNKFVVTLSNYSEYIPDGIEIVTDSSIMDAVGIYRQNTDVVVEIYCRDVYDYALVNDGGRLTLSFRGIDGNYAAKAVVWLPYEDRNRLALPEWRQSLEQFARENGLKLYMASDMYEEYTQAEVAAFANEIGADMVLGVRVEAAGAQQSYMTGVCNSDYFMPGLNSAQLAIVMAESFFEATQVSVAGFEEDGGGNPLVADAKVPSALIVLSLTPKDMESVEMTYQMNGKIVTALESTMNGVLQTYLNAEENTDES